MSQLRQTLRAGELLFREGDAPTTAYLVEQGHLEISSGEGAALRVINQVGPGHLLGEMAILDDAPRSASARAIEDCVLLVLDREQLAERIRDADPIVRTLLEGVLSRYRASLARLAGALDAPPSEGGAAGPGAVYKIRFEAQLREALARGDLEVRYQPIRDLHGDRIAGYEALVRWTHPERGAVAPSEFVALAEETSLIVPVGEYVLDAACALLSGLRAQVGQGLFIAVNVSARQLAAPGLLQRMLERLDDRGLPRSALKLELTESLGLDDERIARVLHDAHAAGIALSLDDFGTGWSNLARLQRLPFETLKLDQAFIHQLHEDPRSRSLTEAVVAMAHALGAEVVVEGVESPRQLDELRKLGCRYAQGYLIGRDVDAAAVLAAGA